ncbi:GTPase [Haliea sp. E1-2-M8]|uniref:GTPase family protein n=1 Tax=Haliea sp. E1-2-M8 TaxID=3064706 RepID=UPI0027235DC0|nr:GTPase [Haliea sp. E1-2-M8]MDO8861977.1 GTPase [Haliea sp. E1-2-M8]
MKSNWLRTVWAQLGERRAELYLAALLLWLLPALALLVLGLVWLWQQGWMLWFSGGLFLLALLTLGGRRLLRPGKGAAPSATAAVTHLPPRPEWAAQDEAVWDRARQRIVQLDLAAVAWEEMPALAMDQLFFVARCYHADDAEAEYAFSAPEFLLMLETCAHRYRADVLAQLPMARRLRISDLRRYWRRGEQAHRLYQRSSPWLRLAGIGLNPAQGILRELGSRLAGSMLGELSTQVQQNLKLNLLEQVIQVAIDLYSGHLQLSERELSAWRLQQEAPEPEVLQPLTVLVLGQVNAGKSSLVNTLRAGAVAEVDSLPSTDGFRRYPLELVNGTELVLVDSPGLDGSDAASDNLLAAALQADLLLWVNAANKPAKALDHHFMLRWREWCAANPRRRPPPLLLVTTHNDLLPPRGDWQPPYDLAAEDDPKATAILDALEYSHQAVGFEAEEPALAIALPPAQPTWNIEVLQELLLEAAGQARSAQLNRQRLEAAGSRGPALPQLLAQARGLIHIGKQVFRGRR